MRDESLDIRNRHRGGFALPVAVFALVIIGVLVTGGFYISQQESRVGVASQNATEALYIAERGLAEVMGDWHSPPWIAMALYEDSTLTGTVDGGEWSVTVTKTGNQSFYMDATGQVTEGGILAGATRRVGVLTTVRLPDIDPPAAITTRGNLTVGGSSNIVGFDTDPDTYTADMCAPSPTDDKPGVMTNNSGNVTIDGNRVTMSGDPQAVEEDAGIGDETFTVFGELTYEDLVDMATYRHSVGTFDNATVNSGVKVTADGTCNTGNPYNWGSPLDPTGPCGDHHPIVHISGSGTSYFQGGGSAGSEVQGQGILLVDGNMEVTGRFIWNGIIIVQGSFVAAGTGNKIFGGVYAGNAQLAAESISGNADILASGCAVDRAIRFNSLIARPRPLADRSWVDVSAIQP